jgi:hypothetical protein
VCVQRRERLADDPRERELAASEGDPEFEHSPGDHSEPGTRETTVEEHHHHETERERTVEHHHHDQGKDGKDGKDGRDGKSHGGGHGDRGRFARKHHRHSRRGILSTLLVGALLLFVLHSFYPNLNIPLVPGIACAPGPITTQTPAGTTPVSATTVEPVGLGSDLGGLAQDTIGAVLKTIAVAAAEKVLHEVGDTVGAMLSHAPSPTDIRTGLANDFEMAGKAVGFVLAGLQGKPLGGGTNVSTAAAVPAGGCGAGSCAGSAVPAATGVNGIDTAARAALRAGWRGEAAVIAVAVAGPESAYQAGAKNRSSTARGMWQTMMSFHAPKYHGASWADPYANARVAHQIWADAGGWGPWVGYTSGAYRGFMARARAAVARVQPHVSSTASVVSAGNGVAVVDGKRISAIAARQLALAERMSGIDMRIMQGGYGGDHIAASRSSHNYPGVMDVSPGTIAVETVLRRVGFAAWARNIPGRSTAGSGAHVHAVSLLDPGDKTSPQVYGSWAPHGNGLSGANNDPAAHVALVPGLSRTGACGGGSSTPVVAAAAR